MDTLPMDVFTIIQLPLTSPISTPWGDRLGGGCRCVEVTVSLLETSTLGAARCGVSAGFGQDHSGRVRAAEDKHVTPSLLP
jgi:hypothetical protein